MNLLRPAALLAALCLPAAHLSAQSVTPVPTVVESDGPAESISTDKETTITFRDNVRVTGTNIKMTCAYLMVVVRRTGDPTAAIGKVEKFKSMLATGNVHIVQSDEREAACGRAEVLPDEDKIVLSETPVIVFLKEGARQQGKRIIMHVGERRVEIEEPVSTLPPVKDLGFEPGKKPATPPPADAPPGKDPAADAPSKPASPLAEAPPKA